MKKINLIELLTVDARFVKAGTKLQRISSVIAVLLELDSIKTKLEETITSRKNIEVYLNCLQYANEQKDSLVEIIPDESKLLQILTQGVTEVCGYEYDYSKIKESLKDRCLDYKSIDFDSDEINQTARTKFLSGFLDNKISKNPIELESKIDLPNFPKVTSVNVLANRNLSNQYDVSDEQYWIESVRLDFPIIPQPNIQKVTDVLKTPYHTYCRYGESIIPWNQSQISSVTDIHKFKTQDILQLFPPIRLYTRSQYMYQKYEGLEYDDDLGVIFEISGYTYDQIKTNIIEYPHLDMLDRVVKIKGKPTTIPFWKHIEILGKIVSTASVWDELEDTRKLPKTESFMNEYVTRKYILDSTINKIEHQYPMRGTLESFLTLYASPSYYESYGYDPVEIGKKCIESRISFKRSRNPVIRLNIEENAELSL